MSKSKVKQNIDILDLNSKIQQFIEIEYNNVTLVENQLIQINKLLNGSFNLRPRILYLLNNLKDNLVSKLEDYKNLQFFNADVLPLIERYHNLNKQSMVIPFFNTNRKTLKEHDLKKAEPQREFIHLIKSEQFVRNVNYLRFRNLK